MGCAELWGSGALGLAVAGLLLAARPGFAARFWGERDARADDEVRCRRGWGAGASGVPAGYHLTFSDDFKTLDIGDRDGDGKRWHTKTVECCMQDTSHPTTPTAMGRMSDPEGKRPFSLATGGGLDIRLQKTDGGWYSGVLATVDGQGRGFSQQYGYFEMKAKFPAGKGTWPAFWLLNTAHKADPKAPAGEIDIVESFMFAPNYVNTTLHDWTPPGTTPAHNLAKVADMTDGFHTYGLLWTEKTMTFYFDGGVMFETPTPAIMHQAYYPIVDLGLGGGWPTDETPQRSDMIVQSVRVWAE